jgi:hypothetical protein
MFRNILYKGMSSLGTGKAKLFEQASQNCRDTQEQRLFSIISRNAGSSYGKDHGFHLLKTLDDFKRSVPVNTYENLFPYIDRSMSGEKKVLTEESPFMFATTSGTTASRKYIPVTKSYINEFRQASIVSGFNLFRNHPGITRGIVLPVVSAAEEGRTSGGIPYGAISGRLFLDEPKLVQKYIAPIPYEVFIIKDYEARYYTILRCALTLPVGCIYTLNPSTIMLLAKTLETNAERLIADVAEGKITTRAQLDNKTLVALAPFLKPDVKRALLLQKLLDNDEFSPYKIWTELAAISCWTKAAASFYLQDFPKYFGDTPVCDITYGASEGRGTVYIDQQSQCLAIRSHFYEFVEESQIEKDAPETLAAWELELGKTYFILFTTSAGLYRYNLNDVIKVVGWHNQAPLIEFMHKGGNISSFTGEKLTESQVTQAVLAVSKVMDLKANFFTVVPEFRPSPHYQLWIEFVHYLPEDQIQLMSDNLDRAISRLNSEYETKRQSLRLAAPEVNLLRPGTYKNLRKSLVEGGVPDAQIKVSHLNPKEEIKKRLVAQLLVKVPQSA